MSSLTTGKRFFNLSKNTESSNQIYLLKPYNHKRYDSESSSINNSIMNDSYIRDLEKILKEKEFRIHQLEKQLKTPEEPLKTYSTPSIPVCVSYLNPENSSKIQKKIFFDQQSQILEKNKKKIEEEIAKEKEAQTRIKEIEETHNFEIQERINQVKKMEEYRNHLEFQERLKNQLYEKELFESNSLSLLRKAKSKTKFFNTGDANAGLPLITREHVLPKTKNLNSLNYDIRGLPAFQQPKYTKNSPKIVPSFPVIGSKSHRFFEPNIFKA